MAEKTNNEFQQASAAFRTLIAEKNLSLLSKGELPCTKNFIFNNVFDLRKAEGQLHPKKSNLEAKVKVSMEKHHLKFVLIYKDSPNPGNASLYSKCFADIIALTYTALGLDMSGLAFSSIANKRANNEDQILNKINKSSKTGKLK